MMEETPEYKKTNNDLEKFEERNPESMPVPVDNSLTSVMQIAIQKNYAPEFIEKMMDLQERHEANYARKQYITAISNFKKIPLEILKDKKVSFQTSKGKTEYDHASLANVVNTISTKLGNHGLSASWKTEQGDFGIKVTCILTHSEGHSEEVSLIAAPDTSGVKNQIQAVASTVSYLERYTLLAITGLATKDMDNDGQGVKVEYITIDMQIEINDLIKSTKADKSKVLEYLKAESVEKILLSDYGKAKVAFTAKQSAMPEPGSDG